jgi:hypothetical protein
MQAHFNFSAFFTNRGKMGVYFIEKWECAISLKKKWS